MKSLSDLRSESNDLTPQGYLDLIAKQPADFVIVTPAQWAYLEQTDSFNLTTIPALNINGKTVVRVREDN